MAKNRLKQVMGYGSMATVAWGLVVFNMVALVNWCIWYRQDTQYTLVAVTTFLVMLCCGYTAVSLTSKVYRYIKKVSI
jgi:uncharacterized membrane protein YqjE